MKEFVHQIALCWAGGLTLFACVVLSGKTGGGPSYPTMPPAPVNARALDNEEKEETVMNIIDELDKNTTVLANAVAKSVRNVNDIAALLASFDEYPAAVKSAILERIAGINSRFREEDMKVMIASLNEVVRITGELVAAEPIPKAPQPEEPQPEILVAPKAPQGAPDPAEREAK